MSVNACTFFGRIEQNYRRYGFASMRGEPHLYKAPVRPGAFPPELTEFSYLRHPVLTFWLLHAAVTLGGFSERTFRVLPILFSSWSAALLAVLVHRPAGAFWSMAALVMWTCIPMSWYVGGGTTYEPFAQALMLVTFTLHCRFRLSGLRTYGLTWIATFLAVEADWVGLTIVPAIVVLESLIPRRTHQRRLKRAIGLGAPAFLAVLVHFALVAWWKDSISASWETFWSNVQHAMMYPPARSTLASWLSSQGRFWRELFTMPVSVIAAVAVPWLAMRCRSDHDPLPRIALALAVPPVIHVLAFRDHAYDHDFWWAYAVPYAVVASVVVIRDLTSLLPPRAERIVAAAVVISLAATCVVACQARHERLATTEYRDQGRDFNRFAGKNDALLFTQDVGLASFYIDAWFAYAGRFGVEGIEAYKGYRAFKQRGDFEVSRIVTLVPDGTAPEIEERNLTRMREVANVTHLTSTEFQTTAPALAGVFPRLGCWILTIE